MGDIPFLLLGLAGLFVGGELLVRGSVRVAEALGMPPLIIGLTLVGFGTSTPELVTSVQAALAGSPGIAVGNVVGSNIGNTLLIVGLAALLAPIAVSRATLKRDGAVMLAASLLCLGLTTQETLGRGAGLLLVALLAAYLLGVYLLERGSAAVETLTPATRGGLPLPALGLAALGLVLTLAGARFAVEGAVGLAATVGISETVIGLTVVAVGTSMPELVTSLVAVRRGQHDIAFGNVIGSNIFNILGILGATALIAPLPVPEEIARFDVWVLVASALVLLVFATTGRRLGRVEGGTLVGAYALYVAVLLGGVA